MFTTDRWTRQHDHLAVTALVLWTLAWGLRATLLDTLPSGADTLFVSTEVLHLALVHGSLADVAGWFDFTHVHPPLPYLLALPLSMAMGFGLQTVRASCVLLHAVALVQVFGLTRLVTGDRKTALLAALLMATAPPVMGWFRVDYQEPLTAVMILATLHLAHGCDLRRAGPAIRLGLVVGLGAITKLSYPAIMLLPALAFLGTRLRSRRALANTGLALLMILLVAGWWYVAVLDAVFDNWVRSTGQPMQGPVRFLHYLWFPLGNLTLTAAALVGAALAVRRVRRDWLALLVLAWGGGYLLFLLLVDIGTRYIMPLLPLSCLLAAVAGAWLLELPRGRPRTACWALAAVLLLGQAAYVNLDPGSSHYRHSTGILVPDRGDYDGLQRAVRQLQARGRSFVVLGENEEALHWVADQTGIIRSRVGPISTWVPINLAHQPRHRGRPMDAVLVSGNSEGMQDQRQEWASEGHEYLAWFRSQRWRLLGRLRDDSPFQYMIYSR